MKTLDALRSFHRMYIKYILLYREGHIGEAANNSSWKPGPFSGLWGDEMLWYQSLDVDQQEWKLNGRPGHRVGAQEPSGLHCGGDSSRSWRAGNPGECSSLLHKERQSQAGIGLKAEASGGWEGWGLGGVDVKQTN